MCAATAMPLSHSDCSPPSVATRPRVAARSPMSGASWWADVGGPGRAVRRGRCGVERWRALRRTRLELEQITRFTPSVLIATFPRDAPARCGAFADERHVVTGDEGAVQNTILPANAKRGGQGDA